MRKGCEKRTPINFLSICGCPFLLFLECFSSVSRVFLEIGLVWNTLRLFIKRKGTPIDCKRIYGCPFFSARESPAFRQDTMSSCLARNFSSGREEPLGRPILSLLATPMRVASRRFCSDCQRSEVTTWSALLINSEK